MVAPININHLPANTRREVSKMGLTAETSGRSSTPRATSIIAVAVRSE